jgi:acyl carrier protein
LDIRDELGRFLADVLGVPLQDGGVPVDAHLVDDLGVDSAGLFELILWLEERFGLKIPPEDLVLDNFKTVAIIEAYIGRALAAARSSSQISQP